MLSHSIEIESMASQLLKNHPNRVPVICKKSETASDDSPMLEKTKYLVAKDMTLGQFIHIIRNKLKLPSEKALFFFANDSHIPVVSSTMDVVYNEYKSDDGFLSLTYTSENTFGKLRFEYK
tara:strand:+ start:298 stop:660 length:363 start_codon:yes stop_codon:yes gene_type:complete